MQKNRILTAILCGVMVISLAGCGNQEQAVPTKAEASVQTSPADVTSATESSDDITAGRIQTTAEAASDTAGEETPAKRATDMVEPESMETPASAPDSTPEPSRSAEAGKPAQAAPGKPAESASQPEPPKPAETPTPAETAKPAEQPKQGQSAPAPEPAQPAESTPLPEPQPTPPAEPSEPAEPEFDINYWISYAQNYAQSVGLILESSAVDCWDNPIGANAQCIYLERDIQSRLNRYAKDDEITDVWIWAESLGGGNYNLYIGYA